MEILRSKEEKTGAKAGKLWRSRVDATLAWRNQHPFGDQAWKRWRDLFLGQRYTDRAALSELTGGNEKINVNVVNSTIRDMLPFLTQKSLEFFLRPKNLMASDDPNEIRAAQMRARRTQALMNVLFAEARGSKAYEEAIQDMLVIGHGVVKTGWLTELVEAANENQDGKLYYDDSVIEDRPLIQRVNPSRFVYDVRGSDASPRTGRWAAELILMPVSSVVSNKNFSKTVRNDIKMGRATPRMYNDFMSLSGDFMSPDHVREGYDTGTSRDEMMILLEVWDRQFELRHLYAMDIDEPLVEDAHDVFRYLDNVPYIKADYAGVNDQPYTPGITGQIEDHQKEKNQIRTQEFEHRRKHGTVKYLVAPNALSMHGKNQLVSAFDEVITTEVLPDVALKQLDGPSIPTDNYRVDAIIDQDIREIVGTDALHQGANLPSRTSAREIDAREKNLGLKLGDRAKGVDQLAQDIGDQLLRHVSFNMDADTAVEVIGSAGVTWEKVTVDDIKQDYAISVHSTAGDLFSPQQEKAQRLQLGQVFLQHQEGFTISGYGVNWPALVEWMLEPWQRQETSSFLVPLPGAGGEPGAPGLPGQPQGAVPQGADALRQGSVNPNSLLAGLNVQ